MKLMPTLPSLLFCVAVAATSCQHKNERNSAGQSTDTESTKEDPLNGSTPDLTLRRLDATTNLYSLVAISKTADDTYRVQSFLQKPSEGIIESIVLAEGMQCLNKLVENEVVEIECQKIESSESSATVLKVQRDAEQETFTIDFYPEMGEPTFFGSNFILEIGTERQEVLWVKDGTSSLCIPHQPEFRCQAPVLDDAFDNACTEAGGETKFCGPCSKTQLCTTNI